MVFGRGIIQVLIQQPNYKAAQNYWKMLKHRLKKEGSLLVTNCHQLKMPAADGNTYRTDAETLLRLVQSVPSPKAEPIKPWLAKVGYELAITRTPSLHSSTITGGDPNG